MIEREVRRAGRLTSQFSWFCPVPNNPQGEIVKKSDDPAMRVLRKSRRRPAMSTLVGHAGFDPMLSVGSAGLPIYNTSTFVFSCAKAGKRAFQLALGQGEPAKPGETGELIYARLNHPNAQVTEQRMACIEGGAKTSLIFNSGMSAITTALIALCQCGNDNAIVFTDPVYGGTAHFLHNYPLLGNGIKTYGFHSHDLEATQKLFTEIGKDRLKVCFIETPANPTMEMVDIALIAKMAKDVNPDCIVIVDNTFLGPVFQKPFKISPLVDLIVYSATKFLGGHSNLCAGFVVFRDMPEAKFNEIYGKIFAWRVWLGTILPAHECAWLMTQMNTIFLRMRQQTKNAMKVAKFLASHPRVEVVKYPTCYPTDSENYRIYKKQCLGSGSLISFLIRDADEAKTFEFLDKCKDSHVMYLAVSLGAIETLISHPASTTHSEMKPEELLAAGVMPNLVRLSVGIEDSEDLIAALKYALDSLD